jgi:nucleoside-diphosphate-sugar epimerase
MPISDFVITGGSGFIGTHLIHALLQHNPASAINVLDVAPPKIQDARVHFHACDIRNPITIRLPANATLFHLAAIAKEPGYPWREYFDANHIGTNHVIALAEANNIQRIFFTSTMMVFRAGKERNSDDDPCYPDTAYGISKLLAEKELFRWQAAIPTRQLAIVRPSVVFGPGENGNYTRLFRQLRRNLFFYMGRKDTIKASVYVKDLVRFLLWLNPSLASHPSSLYNFALPQALTIQTICEAICTEFGFRKPHLVVPFKLALLGGYLGELAAVIGIRNPVHHRRIEKLYHSTDIAPDRVLREGFAFEYPLPQALADWRADCGGQELA